MRWSSVGRIGQRGQYKRPIEGTTGRLLAGGHCCRGQGGRRVGVNQAVITWATQDATHPARCVLAERGLGAFRHQLKTGASFPNDFVSDGAGAETLAFYGRVRFGNLIPSSAN